MNSWDVFDTLIARRYIDPSTIFDEVAKRIDDPSFVKKRKRAEKATKLDEGNYWDIYKLLPEYDPQVELDVELEHNYPIVENMQQVKDGDLIVSDMYLPAEFIMKMLRNCGLTAKVDIVVTRYGKKKGYIWEQIKQQYKVKNHYGDNKHSDVKSPQAHGINGIHNNIQALTDLELQVYQQHQHLAALMRYIRLSCPYDSEEKLYWIDQANLNIPALLVASTLLPTNKTVAFSYRDCANWQKIYKALVKKHSVSLHVSRSVWLSPNKHFNQYINSVIDDNTVIVDLQGKGRSIWTYFNKKPPHTIYIGGRPLEYIETFTSVATKTLEKLNCLNRPTVESFDENGPVYARENDHPENVAHVQMKAVNLACNLLDNFRLEDLPSGLLEDLVSQMSDCYTSKIPWHKFNGLKSGSNKLPSD